MKKRLITIGLCLAFAGVCMAGDTQRWEIDRFEDWDKGSAEGVEIGSDGALRPVGAAVSEDVPAEGIWSMARGKGGEIYLGTGNSGKLMVYRNGKVKDLELTEHVAITRVVVDGSGDVWFSAIPGGVIYRRGAGGLKKVAETGQDYVWDFILDGGDVIAATGPQGKIMRLSSTGKVKSEIETGEEHVMCLVRGGDGKLYAGTSGDGLVLQLDEGLKDFLVLHDFEEKEVKSLVWVGGSGGSLVAAVNTESGARAPERAPTRMLGAEKKDEGEDEGGGDGDDEDKEEDVSKQVLVGPRPAPGGRGRVSGAVYQLSGSGSKRLLVELPKRAVASMAVDGDEVYVGSDQEGKVYRTRVDFSDYGVAYDLEPSQILSLLADDKGLAWIGAGSPAALAKVTAKIMEKPSYTTEVFDAKFPARFGAVDWEARGGAIAVETRSGNVKDPEKGWSDWKTAGPGRPARIKSPDARYLQVKVVWPAGSDAELKSMSIPYRIHNQPHYVDAVTIETLEKDGDNGNAKKSRLSKSRKKDDNGPGDHDAERKLAWKVTNPDDDPLEFKLYFQPPGSSQWIPIATPEPITKTKFDWDTGSVPDGWYRVKVVATDSPANPADEVQTSEKVSERFLVDNRPPEIESLKVSAKGTVSGKARDQTSDISGIQYSIDGGDWVMVGPADGVFDSGAEDFEFDLPPDLEGPHVIAVRAWDRALNMGLGQASFPR